MQTFWLMRVIEWISPDNRYPIYVMTLKFTVNRIYNNCIATKLHTLQNSQKLSGCFITFIILLSQTT